MHQSYGTPVAPLGLGEIGLPMFYTPIAPLGLCKSGKMPDLRVLGSALIDWDFQPVGVGSPNPLGEGTSPLRFVKMVSSELSDEVH